MQISLNQSQKKTSRNAAYKRWDVDQKLGPIQQWLSKCKL